MYRMNEQECVKLVEFLLNQGIPFSVTYDGKHRADDWVIISSLHPLFQPNVDNFTESIKKTKIE